MSLLAVDVRDVIIRSCYEGGVSAQKNSELSHYGNKVQP